MSNVITWGEWLAWPHLELNEEFFLNFIKSSLQGYAEGKSLTCAMIYRGELVGNVSFNQIDNTLKKAEIGYWLSTHYQGKGIVSCAVTYLISYAFSELKLQKIEIQAAEYNLASRAVCERLNMRLEGIITNKEKVAERILDHAIYGITAGEWIANKAGNG